MREIYKHSDPKEEEEYISASLRIRTLFFGSENTETIAKTTLVMGILEASYKNILCTS